MIYEKAKFLIFISILLLPVYRVSADSGGYIVKFNTDISSVYDISRFEEIGENKNTYKIDDLNSIEGLKQYIEYCETNDEVDLIGGTEPISLFKLPDDELYPQQWQTQMINADYAWEFETYGNRVNVAVIDSGCNAHIDLGDNLVDGYNYTDKSKSGDFSDNVGHGTHVTGIIAAQMNGFGIVGVAPKANIYALKCVDKYVSAGTDILATAIYDAVDKYNCRVINLSLGIKRDKNVIYDAVKYAYEKGVIIVAAVGNDGNDTIYYPAGYDEVIGVGAVGITKEKSSFSQKNESVFVVAPGEKVKSLKETDDYTLMQGTSQAAPLVTGAAAIMLSADEDITPQRFKELLKTTSDDLGDTGKDGVRLLQILSGYDTMQSFSLFSSSEVNLEVGNVDALTGDYISVPVIISENEGIAGFNFKLEYDKNKLTPVAVTKGDILNDGSFMTNLIDEADGENLDYITAYWNNTYNMNENGELFRVEFLVNENAEIGQTIPVKLSYDENDLCDSYLNNVGANIKDGNITVTGIEQDIEADVDLDIGYHIGEITMKSADGSTYSKIPQNGNFELLTEVAGICSDVNDILPAKFIVSTYDSAERLISIETKEITEQMIQNGEIAISVDSSVKPISKLKIFIWDSINNMKPLADSITLPNKQ